MHAYLRISNDKVRTKFAKFLEKHGRRLQYSVFEIKNSQRILNLIQLAIDHEFAKRFENTDSIIIYPLCQSCQSKIRRYGYAVHEESEIVFL